MLDSFSNNDIFNPKKRFTRPTLSELGTVLLGLFLVLLTGLILVIEFPLLDGSLWFGGTDMSLLPSLDLVGAVAYVALLALVIRLYLLRFRQRFVNQSQCLWLLVFLLLLFVGLAKIFIPANQPFLPYLFPMATFSIMLAVLLDTQFSILVTVLVGLVIGHLTGGSLELTTYAVMGGLVGILSLDRVERLHRLLWSGVYVALSNITVLLIFHLSDSNFDPVDLAALVTAGGINGALSASLALIGFFLAGNLLGLTTSLQLWDLARPTQPLLRQLLLRAPGTYHHSLLVSNLAEQAAERIGANALLVRVGAYYHDIGKSKRPHFFIENQRQETNVQNQLDPQVSAQIIISHVEDGLTLAKKYGLPEEIQAFIAEHQGTGLIKSFFNKAREQVDDPDEISEAAFRYPGPKPQTRETAVVMLADSCEAAVRAVQPESVRELDRFIRRIITDKIDSGELSECDLTMRDLNEIHHTFVEMMQGIFHHRPEQFHEETMTPAGQKSPPAVLPISSSPTPLNTTPSTGTTNNNHQL